MSANYFTPRGIIDAKKKLKGKSFLHLDIAKTRTNKNSKHLTYYIPVTAKNATGKDINVNIKFVNQVISSNAKIAYGTTEETAKELLIAFRKMSTEDLENSDYDVSKQKAILESNEEFCQAMEILATDYLSVLEEELFKYKGDKIKVVGLKKNRTTYSMMQSERESNDNDDPSTVNEDGKVPLPIPIFRIKLPLDADTKKVGFNSREKGFVYIVYDIKRLIKRKQELIKEDPNAKTPSNIVAKIKTPKGYVDLDVNNAKHFITYLSLISGMINIECVCVAPKSISLKCKFRELHVFRHKPTKMQAIDEEDMNAITSFEVNADEDLDVEVNETDEDRSSKFKGKGAKNNKYNKNNRKAISDALASDGDVDINEPDENTGDVDDPDEKEEDDEEDTKAKAKPKATKAIKASKAKKEESDDEAEEVAKPKAKGKAKKEESDDEAEDPETKEANGEEPDAKETNDEEEPESKEESNEEAEEDEEPEEPKPKAKAKGKDSDVEPKANGKAKKEDSDEESKPKPKAKGKK